MCISPPELPVALEPPTITFSVDPCATIEEQSNHALVAATCCQVERLLMVQIPRINGRTTIQQQGCNVFASGLASRWQAIETPMACFTDACSKGDVRQSRPNGNIFVNL